MVLMLMVVVVVMVGELCARRASAYKHPNRQGHGMIGV